MNYLKMLGFAAMASMALTAIFAGSASATTLEAGGVTQNGSLSGTASLQSGASAVLSRTDGTLANTCTTSNIGFGTVSPFTGSTVGGPISEMTFGSCGKEPLVVHTPGSLTIAWTSGTNGTVTSAGAEITVPTSLGFTVNCKTGTGTHFGTLTGVSEGNATMDVKTVVNCGFLLPSATLGMTYTITGPLGVVA